MESPTYSTASTILTQSRAETKVGSNPIATALQDTAMFRKLHDTNDEFVNYPYEKGMNGWKFLIKEAIIQTKANTSLNGAVTSGAGSVILTSGTNFDSPPVDASHPSLGAGMIKTGTSIYDFFTHEGKSTNTLTTVSGLQMNHASAEAVHKIYALPSDFSQMRAVFRQSNIYMYQYEDSELTQVPIYPYYMLKPMNSTNYSGVFMVFPENIGPLDWKIYYAPQATTISASTSLVQAPDGAGRRYLVEKMNAYTYHVLGEYDLETASENKAMVEIDKCLRKWSVKQISPNSSISLFW